MATSDEPKPEKKSESERDGGDSNEGLDVLTRKLTKEQREKLQAKLKSITQGVGEGGALGATMEDPHDSHYDNDGWH